MVSAQDRPSAEVAPEPPPLWTDPEAEPEQGTPGGPTEPAPPARSPDDEADEPGVPLTYVLERVDVYGNTRTQAAVVQGFVHLKPGDAFAPEDPNIERIRYRLLGTGFFKSVQLALARGTAPGRVVLQVHVVERNTLVIQRLAVGVAESVARTDDGTADLVPYAGGTVAESNLLGTGMSLEVTGLLSSGQWGARVRLTDPFFLDSNFLVTTSAFFVDGREFFGRNPLVSVECPPADDPDDCPEEVRARNAVAFYERGGVSFGFGHDLSSDTRYTLEWQGELIHVGVKPDAASQVRGDQIDPIDFAIRDGFSVVSLLRARVTHDRRNDPGLTTKGTLLQLQGDAAVPTIGSDYSFFKTQAKARHWFPLPWGGHTLRIGGFAGLLFGDAPFFHKFYVSDLTDLIPSRMLEMNLDGRSPPNLLGTSVEAMDKQQIAARVDMEYGVPIHKGDKGIYNIQAYGLVGLYALYDKRDAELGIAGYEGFSALPMDLTFDLGVRFDTEYGLFQLGISTALGFFTP